MPLGAVPLRGPMFALAQQTENRTRRQGLPLKVELTTGQTAVKTNDLRRAGLAHLAGTVMEDLHMGHNRPSRLLGDATARASMPPRPRPR